LLPKYHTADKNTSIGTLRLTQHLVAFLKS
jgi:hypothetical protein